MARKQKTFNAVMVVLLSILFVAILFAIDSMNWMFNSSQIKLLWMVIMIFGVAIFIFQDKW